MTGFLDRMAARATGSEQRLTLRRPSRYEPQPAAEPALPPPAAMPVREPPPSGESPATLEEPTAVETELVAPAPPVRLVRSPAAPESLDARIDVPAPNEAPPPVVPPPDRPSVTAEAGDHDVPVDRDRSRTHESVTITGMVPETGPPPAPAPAAATSREPAERSRRLVRVPAPDPVELIREHVVPVLVDRRTIPATETVEVHRTLPVPLPVDRIVVVPGTAAASETGGDVHVHIDRVEVHRPAPPPQPATAPAARPAAAPRAAPRAAQSRQPRPAVDLDAYLARRRDRR
jgi:hypothetical protein